MSEHLPQWTTPAPLWGDLIGVALPDGLGLTVSEDHDQARAEFQRPVLLRFTRDTFMEEFLTLLENTPDQLGKLRAIRETWRGPVAGPALPPKKPLFERPFALRKALAERAQAGGSPVRRLKDLIRPDTAATDVFGPVPQALKLYQPAHMRHYLVSACLVCQTTGLPDRAINSAAQEHVGFVVRRLIPHNPATARRTGDPYPADEYAFVREAGGMVWKKVGQEAKTLLSGEEQQALFPVSFKQADGRRRRLFSGVVPVGRQAAYMGAPQHRESKDEPLPAGYRPLRPGEHLFITQVIEPWKRLIEMNFAAEYRLFPKKFPDEPDSSDVEMKDSAKPGFIKTTREQIQTTSWLILLDFARLLKQYLPDIWEIVQNPAFTLDDNSPTGKVVKKIRGTQLSTDLRSDLRKSTKYTEKQVKHSLDIALAAIVADPQIAIKLEAIVKPYNREGSVTELADWPPFLFPFGDPADKDHPENRNVLPPFLPDDRQEEVLELDQLLEPVDRLLDSIHEALNPQSTQPSPAEPLANQPVLDPNESWFVLRCVMERPECDPRLSPAVISDATAPFQMAGFFDPDAPARPIRISLPIDTSPAGFRKFDKNTAFLMSDMLCGQVHRAKGMTLGDLIRSVLPWPLHKDLSVPDTGPCKNDAGTICSLSIPIITICALILLMIIVSLLDIIFHWMPFFIMCFPFPKFKAKEA